uniref:CULLIN_2 domain-containing protein n=1 Tax=Panagrellus redivivus TaxID=6233 RepID=A0A7E4VI62_PANRE
MGYLNRHYIKKSVDDNTPDITYYYNESILQWEKGLFDAIEEPLVSAVYQQILKERNGERIESSLITNVIKSILALGINDPELPKKEKEGKSIYIYEKTFEQRFLDRTSEYYIFEAKEFLQQHDIFQYMKKVEDRIREERERVTRYLHLSTLPKIESTIDNAMIIEYLDQFRAEFDNMLAHNQIENLSRMHHLCSRVEGALNALHDKFRVHIVEKGLEAVSALISETPNVDPATYFNTIMGTHKHFDNVVKNAFRNDAIFRQFFDQAMTEIINNNANAFRNDAIFRQFFDQAMTEIINNNAVTAKFNSSAKSSDLVARYCDFLLRKSPKALPEKEIEEAMDQVIICICYIGDKDVFQRQYSQVLAKRLVFKVSASDDFEALMLSKLKRMFGFEYVNKLERMFQDSLLSHDLTAESKNRVKDNNINVNGVDLSTIVLAQGVWPTNFNKKNDMVVPNMLEASFSEFSAYYCQKFNGRKLEWLHNMGRGEVQCSVFSRKYSFCVNTYQLAVLNLYNDADSYTLQQILDNVGITKEELPGVLMAMIKFELFKLEGGVSFGPNTPLETKLELNMKFSSKKMKMDFSKAVPKADTKKEDAELAKDVQDDRIMVIQAAIVRVMKMRKTLAHNALITEVIQQLSYRFKPDVRMIKKCIELLIEKEYLARTNEDRQMYEYLS